MRRRLRGLLLPAVLTCVALVVLASLGNWQVRRLAWKEDLIARVEGRPSSAPVDFRNESFLAIGEPVAFLEANEYRPMLLTGEYAAGGEVLVFTSLSRPRGRFGGPGYWVMTPFVKPPSGAAVLVNRGFVPEGREDAYAAPPGGEQTIEGLVRAAETGSWFTPEPKPDERVFFARNPERLARTTGLADVVGSFFIDLGAPASPPSGLPQAGETRMSFPNNHLQYALTWYGLAAALLAVFAVFVRQRLKEPQAQRLTPPGRNP